jgi:lysophospholipase L1-like esterase
VREEYLLRRSAEDLLCSDGIHPNEKGHALMQEILTKSAAPRLLSASNA